MSRIGKLPVNVPSDVQVNLSDDEIKISGKNGSLSRILNDLVTVTYEDNVIKVAPKNADDNNSVAMWGTTRSNINNMVEGVTKGFEIILEIKGVGYKAAITGKYLVLSLGYSHDIIVAIPDDITIKLEKQTTIMISGANKEKIGQIAGEIISFRPVEPYKGKGVYISGTYIRRKNRKK